MIVIRSGVDVVHDVDRGDTITIVDPTTYATRVAAPGIDYHDTCERHVAPPKASQPEAEYHGMFDSGIGSSDATAQRTALLAALRESGSFLDRTIPSLTDPTTPIAINYLSLAAGPNADPLTLVDLNTLPRGDPLGPGQYLVADTDELILPYLPDPLATGISLRFPDAGQGRPVIRFPGGVEGVVATLHGTWPAIEPYRVVLRDGAESAGSVTGNVLDIALAPGDSLRARLASTCDRQSLPLFGLWQLLPPAVRADNDVAQATADGWLWAFSPSDEVRLVHAVPARSKLRRQRRSSSCAAREALLSACSVASTCMVRQRFDSMPRPRGRNGSTIPSPTVRCSTRSMPLRSPPTSARMRTCCFSAAST